MINKLFTLCALIATLALAPIDVLAATGSSYPSLVLQNQFGEKSINSVLTGSSGWLDCVFTVNAADSAGKGITGLSGAPCGSVFMHTSTTPATGNPNPANGYILINLVSPYYQYLNGYAQVVSPMSGGAINVTTGVTSGLTYVISSLGNTALAGWTNLGLPAGVTPIVGAGFIAASTTVSTGTGQIQTPATSGAGVSFIDLAANPTFVAQATAGAQIILRTLAATSSSVTTLIPTAPATSTTIKVHFNLRPLSTQLK